MSEIKFEEKTYNTESLDSGLWKKILKLLGPQKKNLIIHACMTLVIAGCDIIFPIFDKIAIDSFVTGEGTNQQLVLFIIAYALAVVVQGLIVYGLITKSGRIETGFSYQLRDQCYRKLQELSFSYYDKTPLGWLMARMTSDISRLAEIMAWSLTDIIWGATEMIGITVIMLVVDWKLALLVLMVVPVLAYLAAWFQKRILKNYREVRKTNSQITASFNEGITGAKTTKTLVLEDQNYDEFTKLTDKMRHKAIKAAILSSLVMPVVISLSAIATGAILWYGGNQVILGAMQFGTLMMFTQYATMFFEPLRQIANLMAEMQMAQASGERVLSLLDEKPSITDKPEVIEKYGTIFDPKPENYPTIHGDIEFKDVTFNYLPDEPVLEHFNLKVKSGSTIALVGETGSGKSTIVNLLCRFYEPIEGQILIDGIDYRERSLGWLHSNLGYVLQTPHLFSGTVEENIRYGKLNATNEEVVAAAKLVNADPFIEKLDHGYKTDVGEGGGRLSTGEKQLISFARAVIADPRLFVLDEATSSIDTESEKLIQDAIGKLLINRTSFVVAHRLSTIINSDLIIVMKNGKITEQGTHDQLMKEEGYYYQLYTNQFEEELNQRIMNNQN